jgi:hypothetical protein
MNTYDLKVLMLLLGILVCPFRVLGTAQVPDTIRWNGGVFPMGSDPLSLLESFPSLGLQRTSTACWRGYRAEWEIQEGEIYLMALLECHSDRSLWNQVFPKENPPLHAYWYSGVIRIPEGELLEYVHMGFGSVYRIDNYMVLADGQLKGHFQVTNDFNSLTYHDRQTTALGVNATQSEVLIPKEELIDGDWKDAMFLREQLRTLVDVSMTTATIRGIYFPGRIYLPGNGAVPAMELHADLGHDVKEPSTASPVEAIIILNSVGRHQVHSIKLLENGDLIDRRGRVKALRWDLE